jgi:cell division protein FtsB
MSRPAARQDPADQEPEPASEGATPGRPAAPAATGRGGAGSPAATAALGSLADLPVAGLTRRRIGLLVAAVVAAWVIVLFARQVSEASEAAGRADSMRASNAALQVQVAALMREKALIQRQAYVDQQAREYRLGTTREIPFILSDDAPPLAPDAPGSASVKLGASATHRTPLESWLDLLFGMPADGSHGSADQG